MSYSISKTNYTINIVSLGSNQTKRNNIDFGIYEPTTEESSSPTTTPRVLQGPQVVFNQATLSGSTN